MHDDDQLSIPESFLALFARPGRAGLSEPKPHIAQRYELCEDMAQLLTSTAGTLQFSLGITEADVLQRVHQGLLVEGSAFTPPEAQWVCTRLAELMDWPREFPTAMQCL